MMKVQVLPAEGQAGPREDSPCHKMWNKQEKTQISVQYFLPFQIKLLVFTEAATGTPVHSYFPDCKLGHLSGYKVRPCIILSNFWFSIPKLSGSQSSALPLHIQHSL